MKILLQETFRSRSLSRKSVIVSAPAPAKKGGFGRLRLRNTGYIKQYDLPYCTRSIIGENNGEQSIILYNISDKSINLDYPYNIWLWFASQHNTVHILYTVLQTEHSTGHTLLKRRQVLYTVNCTQKSTLYSTQCTVCALYSAQY